MSLLKLDIRVLEILLCPQSRRFCSLIRLCRSVASLLVLIARFLQLPECSFGPVILRLDAVLGGVCVNALLFGFDMRVFGIVELLLSGSPR